MLGGGVHLDRIILTDAGYAEFPFSFTSFPKQSPGTLLPSIQA
jgi:hypothetical protein